jgi:hypothetical protein
MSNASEAEEDGGLHDVASFGEVTAPMLWATFPQWRIFESGGVWWATRGGIQEWDGPRSLLMRVLGTGDLNALAEKLCLQEWLDGLDDTALEAVYRGTLMGTPG